MDDNEEVNDNLPQESESVQERSSSRNNMVNRKIQERMSKSVKLKAAKKTLIKALLPILTYVLIFLIILIIIIGIVLFFITMPGMVIEQIKEFARKVGNAVASWFGADTTQQVEDVEIYETLDYLEQMGYDLKGYGFLTDSVGDSDDGVERDDNGKIKNAESQFISAYLVSDNYVYTIKNFNQKSSNPISAIGQHLASLFTLGQTNQLWSRGMIDIYIDDGFVGIPSRYYSVYNLGSINVDVEKKELEIKRGWLNNSMKYNLDGWTGRYGMPIDFLISVHLATMMPDLAYEMASSFETRIQLLLHPIGGGEEDDNTAISYYKIGDNYKSYDDFEKYATSGITGVLNSWRISKEEAKNIMNDFGIESTDSCSASEKCSQSDVTETCSECRDYIQEIYDSLKKPDVSDLEIYQPYISKVEDHWYRDVYFVAEPGKEFVDYDYDYEAVMKERWTLYETYGESEPEKEGQYKLYEINEDGTYKKDGNNYVLFDGTQEEASAQGKKVAKKAKTKQIGDTADDLNWEEISGVLSAYKIEGVTQEDFQAVYPDIEEDEEDYDIKKNVYVNVRTTGNVTQVGEGQRTETNPKIKKMFLQNRYLKYDGSPETAEIITALRKSIDSDGYYGTVKGEDSKGNTVDYTNKTATVDGKTYKVSDYSGEVSLNQDSLNAFSMLENEHTLDADYIYRDFKELAVELGYFEKEELTDETPRLLQFLIPEIGSGPSAGGETSSNVTGEKIAEAAKRVYDYCRKHGYVYRNDGMGVGLIDISKENGETTTGAKATMCSGYVASVLIEAGFYDKEGFKISGGRYYPPYAKDFWRFGKSGREMGVKTTGTEVNHKSVIEYINGKMAEMELVQDAWDGKTNARHSGKIDKSKLQAGDILADAHHAISEVGGHVAIYDGNGYIYENGIQHTKLNESEFSRVLRVKGSVGSGDGEGLSGFPNRAIDKNEHEYGTMVHSKGDIDANKANTLKSILTDAIEMAVTEETSDDNNQAGNTVNGISDASKRLDETVGAITAQDTTDNLFAKVGVIESDSSSSSSSSTSSSSSLLSLEEWWEETQKMFDIYKSEGWVYDDHGSGKPQGCNANKTFEEAHNSGHHDTDCSIGASWMLQKLGALKGSKTFTSHMGSGGALDSGACAQDLLEAGAEAFIPKGSVNFTNAANNGELEPGDIIFYSGHVSIYCGDSWEGGGTLYCWDTGSTGGIQGGGPRDDSWENRPIRLIVRLPLGNSTKSEGKPYEGYLGNEAVVSPVTGILLEYGTYDGKEKDSVTGDVYRTNIDLKYGTGLLNHLNTQDEDNTQTQVQNSEETERKIQVDKVGYAKILVLDKESYKKIEQKLLSQTRWSDSFLSSSGKYRDIKDLTEKQINDKNNPWTDIDKTLYGYKEFAESYENFGIAGNVIYIEGFKAETPDEEFDIEADAEIKSPKGEEIKVSDFEKVTTSIFSNGKISNSEDLLESLYERDKDYKLASKKATEKLKAENGLKESAISSLYVNGLKVIKEGTVIGRTITDRELIVDYREEKYEDYRTLSDDQNDNSTSGNSGNNSTSDETEKKDKVIGNYLRIIMRDLDKTVVENVEDYMKLDDVGEEETAQTLDNEKFLYWLGVYIEGGELVQNGNKWISKPVYLKDGNVTHYFGITQNNSELAKKLGYDVNWHGDLDLEMLVDIYLALVEEQKAQIKSELGEDIEDGYLQAFVSILHNYGNLTERADEYKATGKVSETTWTTYNGRYTDSLRKRRVGEWILITEGKYMNSYEGNTKEIDFTEGGKYSEETPFTDWCKDHGVANIQVNTPDG